MQSGHSNTFYVVIRLSRSIKLDDSKDVIYSSFERVEEFDESVSHGKMLETIMDWHANELDNNWCMMWRIITEREAKKLIQSRKAMS